jgi:hypothetical protein
MPDQSGDTTLPGGRSLSSSPGADATAGDALGSAVVATGDELGSGAAAAGSGRATPAATAAGADRPTSDGSRLAGAPGSTPASTFAVEPHTAGSGLRSAIQGTAGHDHGYGAATQHPHPPLQPSGSTVRRAASAPLAAHDLRSATDAAPSLGAGTPATAGESGLAAASGGAAGTNALGDHAQAEPADAGVGLQQALDELDGTIQLAARQGLAQARIALEPAELGEIRIHLVQTAAGLIARVTAGTSAVAQALVGGHGELRQSLTSLGLNLATLELGHHEQAAHGGPTAEHGHNGAAGRGESGQRSPRGERGEVDNSTSDIQIEQQAVAPTQSQGNGALVDVLA